MDKMTRKIYVTLRDTLTELTAENLGADSLDCTIAANLHEFYNAVGQKEGWLKPEYATPLSQQSKINQRKNLEAATDVIRYWVSSIENTQHEFNALETMTKCINYEASRGYSFLEEAAAFQHEQWRNFVWNNQ